MVLLTVWGWAGFAPLSAAQPVPETTLEGRVPELGISAPTQEAVLPEAVVNLLDAPPLPAVSPGPAGRYLLLIHQRGLVPIGTLAAPSLTVAGLRINPEKYEPHAPLAYFGLTLVDRRHDQRIEIVLPPDVTVGYPRWAPDGSRFAFTVSGPAGVELWMGDPIRGIARRLIGPELNATQGTPCTWMPDSTEVLCRIAAHRGKFLPYELTDPTAPQLIGVDRVGGLSQPSVDRRLVEHFLDAQLTLIHAESGERRALGQPAAFAAAEPSPSGEYLLAKRLIPPYRQPNGLGESHYAVQVLNREGRAVRTLSVGPETPAAPRAIHWHPNEPASVVWTRGQRQGDRVLVQAAPFRERPRELFRTLHRVVDVEWLESSTRALVREFEAATRMTHVWLADLQRPEGARYVASRSVGAPNSGFGSVVTKTNASGQTVVRVEDDAIFVKGREVHPEDPRAYLDRINLDTLAVERLWHSDGRAYERVVDLLAPDASELLTHRESASEPPNYVARRLASGETLPVTRQRHPAPDLRDIARIPLRYLRDDGFELSSLLYVPPDYSPTEKLPLIIWAYPVEVGRRQTALPHPALDRFLDFERAFKLFFLLRGYAVLDDTSMPIVEDKDDGNATFIDQIVDNARAAIDAAADTGVVDQRRVGVAGHSYGAFMVANLLAHSRLFKAGVGMSGAYNRTLTPFGFQTERRTLWEARETYLRMSPFLYSDQIEAPLLLVHGLLDDNRGARPAQSQYLYDAIRRNGGDAALLLLPLEGHSYRARTSVMHTAAAMLEWFDRYLKAPPGSPSVASNSAGRSD